MGDFETRADWRNKSSNSNVTAGKNRDGKPPYRKVARSKDDPGKGSYWEIDYSQVQEEVKKKPKRSTQLSPKVNSNTRDSIDLPHQPVENPSTDELNINDIKEANAVISQLVSHYGLEDWCNENLPTDCGFQFQGEAQCYDPPADPQPFCDLPLNIEWDSYLKEC